MLQQLSTALRATLLSLVVTGLLYPLAVTAAAQTLFAERAHGSLVTDASGKVVGSALIGQGFSRPQYVWPRPSAAGDKGYDPLASGGSNLSPTSQKLRDRMQADVARLRAANPDAPGPVPAELVSASGSGLDPELSPEAALWQVPRIAHARGVAAERIEAVVRAHLEDRWLGVIGEPRLNVLEVNLALDRQFGAPSGAQ